LGHIQKTAQEADLLTRQPFLLPHDRKCNDPIQLAGIRNLHNGAIGRLDGLESVQQIHVVQAAFGVVIWLLHLELDRFPATTLIIPDPSSF
jgi:hypothetical protein